MGRSVNVTTRWAAHRRSLRRGTHKNHHLQAAWNAHGEQAFVFEVLEYAEESTLPLREGFHMTRLNTCDRNCGYNSVIADTTEQVRFSEEHRARISAALLGHPVSEENKRAMSAALTGRPQTPEERERRSQAQKGRKHSDETKAKIKANGNLGRKFGPLSEEHRAKLSDSRKGRRHTPEAKEKMSLALKGKPKSSEQCRLMSEQRRGVPRSPESVAKQRETLLAKKRAKNPSE